MDNSLPVTLLWLPNYNLLPLRGPGKEGNTGQFNQRLEKNSGKPPNTQLQALSAHEVIQYMADKKKQKAKKPEGKK